ncbi:class I SAM-dependent methyltransferase [Paeniglutamicibacter cryotolerans]|uniref:2-polyprenyl-3-methyl-5-hydroxy-6-metoxy-1, 4-benzoquinol methylase n=1 Tax=Paeniglutamicibacter cryotolerans TaxID=670079 RepID=A0A839QUL0_9MICC|nr:class I SAM-dependent methyltransferase [Paeniglutamicibacter cryotolerans]MBB2995701.1 2-polyprenyl-3-methyl-5-hydroxy-6-metoxy-1,4-benzoquinol methylase [Paeniglutamicibacter cryotolerans]
MERDADAIEEMDRPDCDPRLLERTYTQFPLVNRFVSGWRGVYTSLIRPALPRDRRATLLDIGCGGGDITINLARWAAKDGFDIRVLGIDPDERAYRFATRAADKTGLGRDRLSFRPAFSSELVAEGAKFDVVVSNHILHHLSPPQLAGLFSDTESLTGSLAIHSDIRRSRSALFWFGAATLPLAQSSFIRRDGLTSIRRSYTADELARLVPAGWQVQQGGLYRNLALFQPEVPGNA